MDINLTKREHQVLLILSTGASNKQIAKKLNVGTRTIESHIRNILYKTNSLNRTEIISKYFNLSYNFTSVIDKTNFKYVKIIILFEKQTLTMNEIAHRVNTSYNYTNSIIVQFKKGLIKI